MPNHKYFKGIASGDLGFGPGMFYMEFDGEWVVRQLENYALRSFHSENADDYFPEIGGGMTDQPLSRLLQEDILKEITQEEFDQAWAKNRNDK